MVSRSERKSSAKKQTSPAGLCINCESFGGDSFGQRMAMASEKRRIKQSSVACGKKILEPADESILATVDVVIPCYNYARYLRACVQTVLSQPGVNVRVLVIDDASTDETAEIGRELEAANSAV